MKSTTRRQRLSITLFVFAAVVFRSEVALLLASTVLYLLMVPELSLERVIFPFAASFLVALATSVPIDSYFWQRPLWPELWGFYYNVVQGSASNWGISPWHYYFTSALPRLLVNPLTYAALIPFSLWHPALRRAAAKLIVPSTLFTAIYSLQPHKETRFIIYAIPSLTAAAALSANFLTSRQHKSQSKPAMLAPLITTVLLLSVSASFLASTAMLALSALNYPGGEAVAHLRSGVLSSPSSSSSSHHPIPTSSSTTTPAAGDAQHSHSSPLIRIHADVLTCMTGLTLFGTTSPAGVPSLPPAQLFASAPSSDPGSGPVIGTRSSQQQQQHQQQHGVTVIGGGAGGGGVRLAVDKTEDVAALARPSFWRQFDYLLVADPADALPGETGKEWEAVGVVKGYGGIEIARPGDRDGDDGGKDGEVKVVGHGRTVAAWKRRVRALTGGWWIGPRMVERVYILRRRAVEGVEARRRAVEAR